jgi:hypothetical protein
MATADVALLAIILFEDRSAVVTDRQVFAGHENVSRLRIQAGHTKILIDKGILAIGFEK